LNYKLWHTWKVPTSGSSGGPVAPGLGVGVSLGSTTSINSINLCTLVADFEILWSPWSTTAIIGKVNQLAMSFSLFCLTRQLKTVVKGEINPVWPFIMV